MSNLIPRCSVVCPNCKQGAIWDTPLITALPPGNSITCRSCGYSALPISWVAAGALLDISEQEDSKNEDDIEEQLEGYNCRAGFCPTTKTE